MCIRDRFYLVKEEGGEEEGKRKKKKKNTITQSLFPAKTPPLVNNPLIRDRGH